MDNAIDIDDPNLRYVSPFLTQTYTLAQTDDDVLAHVLYFLAQAVPDRSVAVNIKDIENLKMLDLRPLLVAGQYDKVARTVLERLSTSESLP